MKSTLAGLLVLGLCVAAVAVDDAPKQVTMQTRFVELQENALAEIGVGWMDPDELWEPTWTVSAGCNAGFALKRDWGLGWQIGGKVTLRDDEPDWLAGVGVFQRGLTCELTGLDAMWGLQGFWLNTDQDADLAVIKPTLGWQLNDDDYVGLSGLWGKNEDTAHFCVPWLYRTQGMNMAGAFWGHNWGSGLSTELLGGYQFDDLKKPMGGLALSWNISDKLSLNASGSGNFTGDYATSIGLGIDLGKKGRSPVLTYVRRQDEDDYTPLPLGGISLPLRVTHRIFM
jgi:hypothetical protein